MSRAALDELVGRHSVGPRHLVEPAPDDAALAQMVAAALRAPDHGGLRPWRLALVRGAARERLATLFAAAARRAGKDEAGVALDAERARRAPLTLAVIARIDAGHPEVPAHEQWAAVGGALANFMNAVHLLGFGGKLLSGHKARDPGLVAAFCGPGETLLGWIALGTPARAGAPRVRSAAGAIGDWGGSDQA
ncbi:MAG: nitroreductase family protein [Pelomonas sp.]|nr:nitroreductase family protein [Roseateles sp.]